MKLLLKSSLLILILSSCVGNKEIVALYGKCKKQDLNCSQIELKQNKTFEYYNSNESGSEKITKGTWEKISESTLILTINDQIENQEKINIDSIKISKIVVSQIPYLSDGKVIVQEGNLIFNANKGWSRFVLRRTRMKNKKWN